MKRVHGMFVLSVLLALVFGGVSTVSAVVLMVVVKLLTLFAVVGVTFASFADVHAVPIPPPDVAACDLVITVLDERGEIVTTRQARVAPGETLTLQHRSRAERGGTEAIRATVTSMTVPPRPLPPGPCPILASVQVVDEASGRTEAVMMPAAQQEVRETIREP